MKFLPIEGMEILGETDLLSLWTEILVCHPDSVISNDEYDVSWTRDNE